MDEWPGFIEDADGNRVPVIIPHDPESMVMWFNVGYVWGQLEQGVSGKPFDVPPTVVAQLDLIAMHFGFDPFAADEDEDGRVAVWFVRSSSAPLEIS